MNRPIFYNCACIAFCLIPWAAQADSIDLTPIDADTIKPFQDNNYNSKAYIYSYYSGIFTDMHVAYMKYDVSSLPDGASITAMNLRMSTELSHVTPGAPARIYRGDDDSWSSTTTDPYPGIDELLGPDQPIHNSFTFYNWDLDVEAVDWQTDLDDELLTLGITSTGYTNWFGLDGLNISRYPKLTIDYTVSAALDGDLNDDGFVGQDDLNIILGAWGHSVASGNWSMGDPSGDGFVGQDDLNEVLGGWGQGTPPPGFNGAINTVPEPQAIHLLLMAGIGWTIALRRHRPNGGIVRNAGVTIHGPGTGSFSRRFRQRRRVLSGGCPT